MATRSTGDTGRAKKPASDTRSKGQAENRQRLRRLKGKVRWEGNLEEMRRD